MGKFSLCVFHFTRCGLPHFMWRLPCWEGMSSGFFHVAKLAFVVGILIGAGAGAVHHAANQFFATNARSAGWLPFSVSKLIVEIRRFEVLMWKISCLVLLAYCTAGPALSADRFVQLTVPSPVGKDIAAMPQISAPVDDVERRINMALKRLDLNVLRASRECKGDDWQRSVDAAMRGPGFYSLVVTDSFNCDGSAHPDSSTMSIVYDLTTGQPVDWTHLLPATLTGTVALEQQADGTKVVTLASKRLFDIYMAGYGAGDSPGSDLDDCKQVNRTGFAGGSNF